MLRQPPPAAGYSEQGGDSSRNAPQAKVWTSATGTRPANVAQEAAARVLAGQKIGPERGSASSAAMQPRPVVAVPASSASSSSDYGKQVGNVQMHSQSSIQNQSSPSGERFVQAANVRAHVPGDMRDQLQAAPAQVRRPSLTETSAPAAVFQTQPTQAHDATPPRMDSAPFTRQDSFVAPPGAPLQMDEDAVARRGSRQGHRQDCLTAVPTSEADTGQTEAHPGRRYPSGSGRQLESGSPSMPRSSCSATSSQIPRDRCNRVNMSLDFH